MLPLPTDSARHTRILGHNVECGGKRFMLHKLSFNKHLCLTKGLYVHDLLLVLIFFFYLLTFLYRFTNQTKCLVSLCAPVIITYNNDLHASHNLLYSTQNLYTNDMRDITGRDPVPG